MQQAPIRAARGQSPEAAICPRQGSSRCGHGKFGSSSSRYIADASADRYILPIGNASSPSPCTVFPEVILHLPLHGQLDPYDLDVVWIDPVGSFTDLLC